jgi:hypothetical protein
MLFIIAFTSISPTPVEEELPPEILDDIELVLFEETGEVTEGVEITGIVALEEDEVFVPEVTPVAVVLEDTGVLAIPEEELCKTMCTTEVAGRTYSKELFAIFTVPNLRTSWLVLSNP